MDAAGAGVMALYIPLLVDWDPTCPGTGTIFVRYVAQACLWDLRRAVCQVKQKTESPVMDIEGRAHVRSCCCVGAAPAPSQGASNIFETFLAAQGSLVPNSPAYR